MGSYGRMPGPAPKDPKRRARRNQDQIPPTILRFDPATQPELPEGVAWPERTRVWWKMWADSAQAEHFTRTDWDFLVDTAVIHALYWKGDISLASELRLRVAKFGATPEDRARLRMQFAEADEADARRNHEATPAKTRFADLKVVQMPKGETGGKSA